MSPDQEAAIRVLWEETPRTVAEISILTGVSEGTISGRARRRGWKSFNKPAPVTRYWPTCPSYMLPWPYDRTTNGRLDAHWAKLKRVLLETEPAIRERVEQ